MAANRIKGITVEIGGDTTKLDKALKGSNKTIADTQKNLKDVEKLLKLDPTNVELLAQKQRLLADATSATSEKLRVLREAASQADEALSRGNAYEAKFAPLKASLDEVGGRLKDLREQSKTMEEALSAGKISTAEYERFTETLRQTETEYDALKQAKTDLDREFEGTKLDQSQYDALQRELAETEASAREAEKAFREFSPALQEFGSAAESVSKKADQVYNATKGISAAAGVAAAGLITMAVKAGQAADDLNTLAAQSGFSAQTIQQWQYASDRVDVSVDTIVSAARKMKQNMDSTSADVQAAWQKIGVCVRDNSGNFRDAEDVFNEVLIGLSRIPNETERDVVAMDLFGKKADELAGIIDDGGAALRALGQEAMDAGLILGDDALAGANAFNDGMDTLKAKATATFMEAGAALAQNLLPVLEDFIDIAGRILEFIGNLDGRILKFILTITMIVAAIAPIAKLISGISGAISGITQVAGIFSATAGNSVYMTFAKWALIIVAVVAAVTALIAVIAVLTGKADDVSRTMNSLGGYGSSAVGGVQSAGRTRGISMESLTQGLPAFASGGVFMPNHPMVGILGDNKTEREIAAPESTLRSTFSDVLKTQSGGGSGGTVNAVLQVDGVTFARLIAPYMDRENTRRGVSLVEG